MLAWQSTLIRWVPKSWSRVAWDHVLFGMFASSCCDPPAMLTTGTVMTSTPYSRKGDGWWHVKSTGITISPANFIKITSNSDQRREGPTSGIGHFGGWCTVQVAKSDTHIRSPTQFSVLWTEMRCDGSPVESKKERKKQREKRKKENDNPCKPAQTIDANNVHQQGCHP